MESDGGMWKSDSLKETVIGCEVECEARRECEGGRKREGGSVCEGANESL